MYSMLFEHLLILLTAIWGFRKLFQCLGFPDLFGEMFAGFIVGPMMLGWVSETEAIRVLAELGVFFLMFHAGLEFSADDISKSFRGAFWIALGGILVSFLLVFMVSDGFGFDPFVSVFLALILSVSSVEISARMFKEYKLNRLKIAQLAVTAAIVTEVILLIVFSMYLELYETRAFDLGHMSFLLLKVFGYFAFVLWFTRKFSHYLHTLLYKGNKGFTLSLIVALLFSVFAESIGLHFIIGAFLAGLFLQKELIDVKMYDKLEDRVFGLSYSFLGPIFFASLAFHLDFASILMAPVFSGLLLLSAFAGKMIGSGLAVQRKTPSFSERCVIGLSMNNRGAMALILAGIGLKEGIIPEELFSILVVVSLVTTFVALMGFKPFVKSLSSLKSP